MQSAAPILPIIFALEKPRSVVDVGCGVGPWAAVAKQLGVQEILGIDGAWVEPLSLLIPKECFVEADLARPLKIERTFGLAMCMEVAEHLPPSSATIIVESLVRLAPMVLFSAAVPAQGGVNHVNEQWPRYWEALFRSHGYCLIDCVRSRVWDHTNVAPWYVQNCFLFARSDHLIGGCLPPTLQGSGGGFPLDAVHPRLFAFVAGLGNASVRQLIGGGHVCSGSHSRIEVDGCSRRSVN